jgi:hypothetical protein
MSNIVFITGAPGSGKPSVSHRAAENFPRSVHLPVDQPREMLVKGVELPQGQAWNMESLGFEDLSFERFSFGIAAIHAHASPA